VKCAHPPLARDTPAHARAGIAQQIVRTKRPGPRITATLRSACLARRAAPARSRPYAAPGRPPWPAVAMSRCSQSAATRTLWPARTLRSDAMGRGHVTHCQGVPSVGLRARQSGPAAEPWLWGPS
jgi:hypothetical protein